MCYDTVEILFPHVRKAVTIQCLWLLKMLLEVRQAGDIYPSFHCIQVMHHVLGSDVVGCAAHVHIAFSGNNQVLKVMILDILGMNSYQYF